MDENWRTSAPSTSGAHSADKSDKFNKSTSDSDTDDDASTSASSVGSWNENRDSCPICLHRLLKRNLIGNPDCCNHLFCDRCIQEWSRSTATCPIDRKSFQFILLKNGSDGAVVRKIVVEKPVAIANDDELSFCEVCRQSDREDRMLLCDGCDAGYHMECLTPPLEDVPLGEWFCMRCAPVRARATRAAAREPLAIPRTRANERVRARVANQLGLEEDTSDSETESQSGSDEDHVSTCDSDDGILYEEVTNNIQPVVRAVIRRKPATRRRRRTRRTRRRTTKTSTKSKLLGKLKSSKSGRKRYRRRRRRRRKRVTRTSKRPTLKRSRSDPSLNDNGALADRKTDGSIKRRLADQLGIVPPKRGHILPSVKSKQPTTALAAAPGQLSIFGVKDELIFFEDEQDAERQPAATTESVPLSSKAQNFRRPLRPRDVVRIESPPQPQPSEDLLGDIFKGQNLLMAASNQVKINRDGTLEETDAIDSKPKKFESKTSKHSDTTLTSADPPTTSQEDSTKGGASSFSNVAKKKQPLLPLPAMPPGDRISISNVIQQPAVRTPLGATRLPQSQPQSQLRYSASLQGTNNNNNGAGAAETFDDVLFNMAAQIQQNVALHNQVLGLSSAHDSALGLVNGATADGNLTQRMAVSGGQLLAPQTMFLPPNLAAAAAAATSNALVRQAGILATFGQSSLLGGFGAGLTNEAMAALMPSYAQANLRAAALSQVWQSGPQNDYGLLTAAPPPPPIPTIGLGVVPPPPPPPVPPPIGRPSSSNSDRRFDAKKNEALDSRTSLDDRISEMELDDNVPPELVSLLTQFAQIKKEQQQNAMPSRLLSMANQNFVGNAANGRCGGMVGMHQGQRYISISPGSSGSPSLAMVTTPTPEPAEPTPAASNATGDCAPKRKPRNSVKFDAEVVEADEKKVKFSKIEIKQKKREEKLKKMLIEASTGNNDNEDDELPSSACDLRRRERVLAKFNHQVQVEEAVKVALRPYYSKRKISKEEYKEIMRKCVPKICKKKAEIKPTKIKAFVESYVAKVISSKPKRADVI